MRLDRSSLATAVILLFGLTCGCVGEPYRAWGEPVNVDAAVPLARLLSAELTDEPVTTSGRIGEVCRAAGCWFVLHDTTEGVFREVLVDLKPAADFSVPPAVHGRDAVVHGRLVGTPPDIELHATGLVLE